jgi:hypothetical protein
MSINTTDCDKITDTLKKKHTSEIEALKKQIEALNKTHASEIEALKKQIEALKKTHVLEIEALKKTHVLEIEALKKTHDLEIEALKEQIDVLNSITYNSSSEEKMLRQEIKNINKNSKRLLKTHKSSNMSNKEKLYCIMTEIKDIMIHNERTVISDITTKTLKTNIMSYLDGTSCSGYRRNNRNRNNRSRRSSRSRNSRRRNSRRRNSRYFDYIISNLSNNELNQNSNYSNNNSN